MIEGGIVMVKGKEEALTNFGMPSYFLTILLPPPPALLRLFPHLHWAVLNLVKGVEAED